MRMEKRKPTGREKDEASIKLLEQLRERLYSDNVSTARRVAFNLSWMQEDGLDILKEALLGDFPKRTKTAAAYGLRSMGGRMKEMALEVFREGLERPDSSTREVCEKALSAIGQRPSKKPTSRRKAQRAKLEIRDIPSKRRQKRPTRKQGNKKGPSVNEGFSQR